VDAPLLLNPYSPVIKQALALRSLIERQKIEGAMYRFADKTELLAHARQNVEQAVNSLRRDVKNCLKNEIEPSPFPALLFCFSTIDLLGALVSGRVR
jgi:hypothetical protein